MHIENRVQHIAGDEIVFEILVCAYSTVLIMLQVELQSGGQPVHGVLIVLVPHDWEVAARRRANSAAVAPLSFF